MMFSTGMGVGLILCLGLAALCIWGIVKTFRSNRKGPGIAIMVVLGIVALVFLLCGACFGTFYFGNGF